MLFIGAFTSLSEWMCESCDGARALKFKLRHMLPKTYLQAARTVLSARCSKRPQNDTVFYSELPYCLLMSPLVSRAHSPSRVTLAPRWLSRPCVAIAVALSPRPFTPAELAQRKTQCEANVYWVWDVVSIAIQYYMRGRAS